MCIGVSGWFSSLSLLLLSCFLAFLLSCWLALDRNRDLGFTVRCFGNNLFCDSRMFSRQISPRVLGGFGAGFLYSFSLGILFSGSISIDRLSVGLGEMRFMMREVGGWRDGGGDSFELVCGISGVW
ncbi:hypothetical protein EX30DRAFT_34532 [Ascodesmis nigricans]|uniref:Uncharacterized protein n=1 Tax=Ascodesmis nigricans TaxID=341454 RepID=A0A4S2MWM3_9PEZI|nr:hypothetical protein EX30DRAFT_34532 [Ascodesmis nigricans]